MHEDAVALDDAACREHGGERRDRGVDFAPSPGFAAPDETGATAMKDMGRVMTALKERYAGKLDFGKASGAVKKMLSGG